MFVYSKIQLCDTTNKYGRYLISLPGFRPLRNFQWYGSTVNVTVSFRYTNTRLTALETEAHAAVLCPTSSLSRQPFYFLYYHFFDFLHSFLMFPLIHFACHWISERNRNHLSTKISKFSNYSRIELFFTNSWYYVTTRIGLHNIVACLVLSISPNWNFRKSFTTVTAVTMYNAQCRCLWMNTLTN